MIVTLWWLFFWTAIGLCVGSFLNVVIYRLPREQSLTDPFWSACPYCRHRIQWYDNIPLLSFILLRGRCRYCLAPIATRYFVIEAAMALIVLLLVDAFFIAGMRGGISDSPVGLSEQLAYDWPILVAHIILFACALASAAFDVEHYWVDVRIVNVATISGFVFHTLWTPRHSQYWLRPDDSTAVVAILALCGVVLVWAVMICQPLYDKELEEDQPPDELQDELLPLDSSNNDSLLTSPSQRDRPRIPLFPKSRAFAWLAGGVLLLSLAGIGADRQGSELLPFWLRAALPLTFFLLLILREGTVNRESDVAIVEELETERHGARRMVMEELLYLLPAIVLGAIGVWIMAGGGSLAVHISGSLHDQIHIRGLSMLRSWSPWQGFATAATGYIVAGAIGWAIRIGFTLLFGKEAFGVGDIHLMAAVGCVAGWPVVVVGFALTSALALLGFVLLLPFKRSRAIPLVPWLSISFLITVVFYDKIVTPDILDHLEGAYEFIRISLFSGNSQLGRLGVGL